MTKFAFETGSNITHKLAINRLADHTGEKTPRGGGGVLGSMFAGYVPLASQSPHPILVYFLANYRPHLSHFLENVIFAIPT